ncbi:MAG: rhombosortase [Pirellulales bacterium]|nr:rhombosortase [Pirellulales bacterium]
MNVLGPFALIRTFPVTIGVSLLAVFAWLIPTWSEWLQLDFAAAINGQWWRILTGHLTHYGSSHLFWDLLMFAVLGAVCEKKHGLWFGPLVAMMAVAVSAAIGAFCQQVSVYRGLSGIDTGLFVWIVTEHFLQAWRQRDAFAATSWLVPGLAVVGKSLFEAATGKTLFVDSATFIPLVQSHLAGATFGLLCGLVLGSASGNRIAMATSERLQPGSDAPPRSSQAGA